MSAAYDEPCLRVQGVDQVAKNVARILTLAERCAPV